MDQLSSGTTTLVQLVLDKPALLMLTKPQAAPIVRRPHLCQVTVLSTDRLLPPR